jgi:serine/threonine protein kinase
VECYIPRFLSTNSLNSTYHFSKFNMDIKIRPEKEDSKLLNQVDQVVAKLATAHVASAKDREYMIDSEKRSIHTVKVLGEGAFGIVDLVVVDTTEGGLLCVRKKLLKQSKNNNNDPEVEVHLMEECTGCNFVLQLWSHVMGLYDVTLLLEYCPYGTLFHMLQVVSDMRSRSQIGCWNYISDSMLHLNRKAGLQEDEARFYLACMVLGVQSLHNRGLLHRDLKPDNCLIDEKRYIKVADLGLGKDLGLEGKRAYSKAGTPGYMAPEVFHSQGKATGGYTFSADVWSLGVILWQMVDGDLPRWACNSWYWTKIHFPDTFSQNLRSLLLGLLDKAPMFRITLDQVKVHPWFEGFDWDALARQEMEAPQPPELDYVHIHVKLLPEHLKTHALRKT